MTIKMLDLQFNPSTKFYTGPVQMKANNGLLIIDDFGRQRVSPEELLNRWVVPLDRRIDFLTLAGGKKIEIPFDLFVVFATNLDPAKMMDEAFLRRIQTKIKVDFVTPDQFREIFRRACLKLNIECDVAVLDGLLKIIDFEYKEPLRACYPRDILQQIIWEARYLQKEPRADRDSIAQACRNYFLAK
jgi:SpoVK/Ycf46/Vps4 family AAA+-type ATPase